VGRRIQLKQRLEGARLDVEEMGHLHPLIELAERNLFQRFWHESPARRRKTAPLPSRAIRASGVEAEKVRRFECCDRGWKTIRAGIKRRPAANPM
jgi:hypothetical protein